MGFFSDIFNALPGASQYDPLANSLFNPVKPPPIPAAPAAPTLDNSQAQLDAADQEMAMRMNRGRTSTILNGSTGVDASKNTSKILLGS